MDEILDDLRNLRNLRRSYLISENLRRTQNERYMYIPSSTNRNLEGKCWGDCRPLQLSGYFHPLLQEASHHQ